MESRLNAPQIGMIFSHPSLIKGGQFLLLVNGNIQAVDGNFAMITNDHSNLLATKFKEGFKVIGTNVVPSLSTTFFFLYNPLTLQSEIGFIFDTSNQDKPDAVSENSCENKIIEDAPLEEKAQYPLSQYYTFVNADCLNFDIDHPITSWIKIDDCNVRIYFNDFKNPPRYIDYKGFQKINLSNCPLIETDQLNCDKILIFPETCYPIVDVVDVIPGGQNTAGVYQFAICYSDVRSNKITDYFYVTNPIPLYDQPIIPNGNTAYPVAKSFKIQISNLNTDFKYFNLAVLKTINNVTSAYLVETFEINSSKFEYIYTGVDKNLQADLSIDEIIEKRPYYNKAKITAENNGYLFMANLEEDRILNLQPVVNEIPLRWQTVEATDGDYANPIFAQNYVGYLGDEVYAFGIAFTKKNGKQTNVFAFVNREATPYDLEDVSCILDCADLLKSQQLDCASGLPSSTGLCRNPDVIRVSTCSANKPELRWQVYNTASITDESIECVIPDEFSEDQEIQETFECYSNKLLMVSSTVNQTTGELIPIDCSSSIPMFWLYPPSGTISCGDSEFQYPPQTPAQIIEFENCYSNVPGNIIDNIQNSTNIGFCDCEDYRKILEDAGAKDIVITQEAFNLCPNSDTSSIEILEDEYVITVNTYGMNTPNGPLYNNIPEPGTYPYDPNPCRYWVSEDNNSEKGYIGWFNQKSNNSAANAETLSQSYNSNCNSDTWGAFLNLDDNDDNINSDSNSWYNFYCTNQDGVAGIIVSTANTGFTVEVYESDQNGNISTQISSVPSPTLPYYEEAFIIQKGRYILLRNLTYGSSYFINVKGYAPKPGSPLCCGNINKTKCKEISFKICVVSPPPANTSYKIVPAVVKISKRCNISYKGKPINTCKPLPYQRGNFAYWESTETYPCNPEVWEDLAGKPIRHFKFPDNSVIPFFKETGSYVNGLSVKTNKIYPKGIVVDIKDIKNALNQAVDRGLISSQELSEICGYRIYRGNRRGNQSIIAKGLLYDVWEYKDNIYNTGNSILFPNFPFNDNNENVYIKTKQIKRKSQINDGNFLKHPYGNVYNNKYTFDAPNLSFNNPGLGTEIKLEGEQVGIAVGSFPELRNNTKYQYIGAAIISASIGFASVEAAFEALQVMATATLTLNLTVFGSGSSIPLGLILAAVGENILAPIRIYSHYAEWYEIIKKFAPFRNYAVYYTGVGRYTNIVEGNVIKGNTRRTVANAQYIKQGMLNVKTTKGSTRFNNFKRDSSVFIELDRGSVFLSTKNKDTSRQFPSCDFNLSYTGNLASYYASLKNPIVNQYGQIDNIEWIDTGYNGRIDWDNPNQDTTCDTIFGGDTYITRFTKKRKVPMFLEDRVIPSSATQVSPINQDIQLSLLPNIGYPRFWMDYPTALDYTGATTALFGNAAVQSNSKVDFNFICQDSDGQSWKDAGLATAIIGGVSGSAFGIISLPIVLGVVISKVKKDLGNDMFLKGKYIHSFYGISTFLCESDYNLELRHGENIKEKNFYPNVGDINEWTQEFFVPMYEDNYYLYNNDYSKQNTFNPNFVLNNDFKQAKEDCKVSHPNRVIYSLQDNDSDDRYDGNLIFLANNYYDFPKSGGRLIIIKGIENGKVLVIQENRASVFNSYISLQTNVATATVGSNTLFNKQAPSQFIQTDLGFGGSQTPAIVSTEFGHFWVDNKRGQILNLQDGISNIIKPEEEWWFKENLPFHILKDFPDFDITNNFKYIGMSIVYDARYKRVIFTKRDVELKPEYKGLVTYDGVFFRYEDKVFTVENSKYFCNKSWTISYSPLLKSFISFHSFTPNYYVPNQAYFSSGINYSFDEDSNEYGLWYHNLTNKSYQVYYGKLEPFIFEYSLNTKYTNLMLESVRYNAEFYRFQDNLSSSLIPNVTYNKALIYNQKQSSGLLELIPKEKNNRRQYIQYPKQNTDSRSILVEYVERGWQFNNFYDVAVENSGQPLMSYQCDNIAYKEINPLSITYKSQFLKKKLVSDYHIIRLINDKHSNYLINHRFSITQTNNINQ